MADQQNDVDPLSQPDYVVLKDDVAFHLAGFQPRLKLAYLIFPCIGLLFVDFEEMLNQLADDRTRVILDKTWD